MRILFIHQNFPAQYVHLAPALTERGHEVRALALSGQRQAQPGVQVWRYGVKRGNTAAFTPGWWMWKPRCCVARPASGPPRNWRSTATRQA